MRDDLGWAGLPETDDPALAEWVEGDSCSPPVKALAVRAADAAGWSVSAAQWPNDLLAGHPDASAPLAGAEECMRGTGLWPGHDRMAGTDRADG